MNLIDAGSSQVCNSYRLIVISHQRSCVPVSPYQYRECCSRTGRDRLTKIDIEPSDIVPVAERMVRKLQSHILSTDCYSHRRKSVVIHSAEGGKRERKSCKKVRPHIYLLSHRINPSSYCNRIRNHHGHIQHHLHKHRMLRHDMYPRSHLQY